MKLLIMGATGLVGGHVLKLALYDPRISEVTAPVRRPVNAHSKLSAPIVDYDHLPPDASFWSVDAVICALGTTIRKASSQDAFRRVDHGYPLAVARHAHAHGAGTFVLNSALGADVNSRFFYSRVKGEIERDLATIAFASLTFVRPGLIGGERSDSRPMERAGSLVLGALGPALPRAWRINPATKIASALIGAAASAKPGMNVITSSQLV